MGLWLIRITAMFSALGFAGRVAIDLASPADQPWQRRARWMWTIGCVALLAHVAAAFHYQHGWSHAAAWEHTRAQTLALTGWNFGHGLYANYAMTGLWLIDVVGWWTRLDWPRRYRIWYRVVLSLFGFLMFNATAVFGPWYWGFVAGVFVLGTVGARIVLRRN